MLFLKFDSWQQQQQCLECDFHFSVQYRTPLSQFEDKSVQHWSLYCCLAVWLCKAHEDKRDQNIKKNNKKKQKTTRQSCVTYTRKPSSHGERRVTQDTMLKIEDAAGVNLPVGTDKFKTRKINADKAKKVCLCWGLTSQSTIFQSCRDGATASWVINQYFWGVKCLAQGNNTVAVGFKPRTSRSGVRHSTTEPPRSPPKTYMHKSIHGVHSLTGMDLITGMGLKSWILLALTYTLCPGLSLSTPLWITRSSFHKKLSYSLSIDITIVHICTPG